MRRYPVFAAGAAVAMAIASGCSTPDESAPPSAGVGATTSAVIPAPAAPGEVGVSLGGVTTSVGAPAQSTEDDYFQACLAARTWMEQRGGVARTQIEPYLASVQNAQSAGPGTFDRRWPELTPGEQSAVIVAAEAAADALCG